MSDTINFDDYQHFTSTTAVYPKDKAIEYVLLGLSGEVGEMCNKYKKVLRGDEQASPEDLHKELGDVLWYVARLADELGTRLNTVAEKNITKLTARKEAGTIKGSGDDR